MPRMAGSSFPSVPGVHRCRAPPHLHIVDRSRALPDEVVPSDPIVVPALDQKRPQQITVRELLHRALQ